MMIHNLELELKSSDEFDLEKAVCNHGVFMMSPNKWIPSSKTLERPLRLVSNSNNSVLVSINQSSCFQLTIQIHSSSSSRLDPKDEEAILDQVVRMLRLTNKDQQDVTQFQHLHPRAKLIGFGRIFRSPTPFEDAVKSILLCNCPWGRALGMANSLCEIQAQMSSQLTSSGNKKRKRTGGQLGKYKQIWGNFPNAEEVCRMGVDLLKKHSLGYRAHYIFKFAQNVQRGKIDLKAFERPLFSPNDSIINMKGFGPFATANLLMCLGFYHQLPIDTETIRHIKQVHGRQLCTKKTVHEDVKQIYDKYAPFQCIAYWLELVDYYESKFGKLGQLCSSDYNKISGSTVNF